MKKNKIIKLKMNKIKLIIPNFPFKIYANNKEVYQHDNKKFKYTPSLGKKDQPSN